MYITRELLQQTTDFDAADQRVASRLACCIGKRDQLLMFLMQYASWNSVFANGVVALTALIGSQKKGFVAPDQPLQLADRSNFVASYIFDAARDEFDDSIAVGRDPHRSLAQACVAAAAKHLGREALLDLQDPVWLEVLNNDVMHGYTWSWTPPKHTVNDVLEGIGFHLGSEILADREFSIIDEHLRVHWNDLVQSMMRTEINIGGETHRGYAWIGIHSKHGGGVEEEHFQAALEGVNAAIKYAQHVSSPDASVKSVLTGFRRFAHIHERFFTAGEDVAE